MDALSETLRVVQLVAAIFIDARFSAPWCYDSPSAQLAAPLLEPSSERVIIFHMLTEGECFAVIDSETPVRLSAGDVVIFPQGDAHRMMSEVGLPAGKGNKLSEVLARRPRRLAYGGGGAKTNLVCGYLACDDSLAKLIFAGLPKLVRVNVRDSSAGPWLETSLRYALMEARSPRPGGAGVLAKLAELLFIEVLRTYIGSTDQEGQTGWLVALNDRIVGRTLAAIHERPEHPWTLDELSSISHSSRSQLAERFHRLVGTPPIQYLTHWRMQAAANLLLRSNVTLGQIAEKVGYQTDTAFSKAFRREFGSPPASWRRTRRAA